MATVVGIGGSAGSRRLVLANEVESLVGALRPQGGDLQFSGGVAPTLAWRVVKATSAERANLAERAAGTGWQPVGATRDGRVAAFRNTGRTLHLTRLLGDELRIELSVSGCTSYGLRPPVVPDVRWLQFGISPVDAYLRRGAPDVEVSPCPTEAYWTGGDQPEFAVLITVAPIMAILQRDAPIVSDASSQQVSVGVGLPRASLARFESPLLRSTTLVWPLEGRMFSYRVVGDDRNVVSMRRTACRTLRPALMSFLCDVDPW